MLIDYRESKKLLDSISVFLENDHLPINELIISLVNLTKENVKVGLACASCQKQEYVDTSRVYAGFHSMRYEHDNDDIHIC
ncbi:hypothetical protein M0802_007231 [Mischocyttarus mexicanus]|nr:hypothetical protein M0802_007231 [Mischocyttarus mexicanus]